jgi:AcrR family transcriptional regulator
MNKRAEPGNLPLALSRLTVDTSVLRQKLRERQCSLYRDTILDAAEELLAQKGGLGTKVADIAEAAGVSIGTVYNYFKDKNALLSGLFDRQRTYLRGLLERPYESTCAPEQLRELIERVLRLVESETQHIALMARIAATPRAVGRDDPTNSEGFSLLSHGETIATLLADHLGLNVMITGVIRRGIEDQRFRDDLPVKTLVRVLQAVVLSAATDQHEQPETLTVEQRRDFLAALVLDGALARNGPSHARK